MTTARVLLVGLVIAVGSVTMATGTAGASCIGPEIATSTGPIDRGQVLAVEGSGFGDGCYDTGPPPAGQGALGHPVTDIEIVITQGSTEIVVARGDADARYAFTVAVIIPVSLHPGQAAVSARSSHMSAFPAPQPLTISAQPAPTTDQSLATFGPNVTTDSTDGVARAIGEPADQSSSSRNPWTLPLTLAVGLVAFAAIMIRRRRPRR